MPIKGLSEKRRLPRLGKIHLGIRNPEKGYPMKTDYFVCPPEVQKVFGEKPKELRILIPMEDEEKWASQYYRCYSMTRGLICKGDGETAIRMVDTVTGAMADRDSKAVEMRDIPCAGRECSDYKVKCKEVMNLQFLLPEVPGLGVWQIDTSSINSIRDINSGAAFVKAAFGHIAMIPLLLSLEPREVNNPTDGKKQTVYTLNLRTNAKLFDLAQSAKTALLQLGAGPVELPIADDERPDLIAPEFEPDPVEVPPMTEQQKKETIDALWPDDNSPSTKAVTKPATEKPAPVAEQPATPPVVTKEAPAPPALAVDMAWLKESLQTLEWNTVGKYLKDTYGVTGVKVSVIIPKLTVDQQKEFAAEVQKRLELSGH